MWWVVLLLLLSWFSLSLAFDSLVMICLGLEFFEFILSGVIELLGCVDWHFSSNLENFRPLFLQIFFMPLCHSSLLLELPLCTCCYSWWCPTGLWGSVLLSSFFISFLRMDTLNWPVFKFTYSFSDHWKFFLESFCSFFFILLMIHFNYRISFFLNSISFLLFFIWWDDILILSFHSLYMVSFSSLTYV